jgi:ubiquitin-protein ligase E3 C
MLMNTSSVSRKLAGGEHDRSSTSAVLAKSSEPSGIASRKDYSPDLFLALCRTYSIVLARWGGGGKDDVVRKISGDHAKGEREVATSKPDPCALALLNVLCFSTPVIRATWGLIQSDDKITADVYSVIDSDKGGDPVRSLKIRPSFVVSGSSGRRSKNDGAVLLFIFTSLLSHSLIITDDIELHDMDRPIPIHQLRRCIQVYKKLLYRACAVDDRSSSIKSTYFGLALIIASSRTMRDLYDRSSRRPLCVPKLWLVPDLLEKEIRHCKTYDDFVSLLSSPVLRVCPFLVSFKRRLRLFERIITTNRVQLQGENSQNPFHTNPLKPGIPVRITRGRILEDGLATMNNLGANMRRRIAVQYYNEAGTRESGIDAGGLFKEFWTDLSAVAFNENYALFRVTDGAGNCLYPNPSSRAAHGSEHIVLFEFLGRILGKALFEGITIHPRFAHFFLSFLRGDYNFLHMLPDLSTVDPQLYNNLMFLKTYDGDAEDLCLSFTVTVDDFGGTREIPLIPNGANVDVTNANKQRYIGLVAKFYVVDRVREQSEAFTRGLWEVIDRSWLRLFNEPELQVLISGASDGKIDVEDMRANARYVGGFTGLDRTVNRFWNVVASLDSKQQASLLRFVTSCERPPPLGFGSMNPPFTIQRVGIMRDSDKLPSSSTCFNVLKLPTYSSEKVMKQRLIYAIESGAGFELS